MTRRDLAVHSFWSERPLVMLYMERTGLVSFTLRELIAFAEQLPDDTFEDLAGRALAAPAPSLCAPRRPIHKAHRPRTNLAPITQGDQS